MKELKIKHKSKILNFITGKGFFLSLSLSLTLVGTIIWFVMNKSIDNVVDKNIDLIKNPPIQNNIKSVDNIVENIPINKTDKSSTLNSKKKTTPIEAQNDEPLKDISDQESSNILFVAPLLGDVINEFSNNELVKNKTLSDWRVHNGVDISATQGTPVKSIADGEVVKIYSSPMLGICIEIEHKENLNSTYCGLNKNVNVKEGDQIEAGDIIGSVGNTAIGEAELGAHLHLEIKENGVKINPLSKFKLSN